jgi:hypothetical protein
MCININTEMRDKRNNLGRKKTSMESWVGMKKLAFCRCRLSVSNSTKTLQTWPKVRLSILRPDDPLSATWACSSQFYGLSPGEHTQVPNYIIRKWIFKVKWYYLYTIYKDNHQADLIQYS